MNIKKDKKSLVTRIINESKRDVRFKERLIETPYQTIKKVFGDYHQLRDRKIVVEDQSDSKYIYINIPPKIDIDDLELSDDELEKVAGGVFTTPVCVALAAAAVAYVVTEAIRDIKNGDFNANNSW